MYVWQMNDGRWHISILTSQRGLFPKLLANKTAFSLFDRGYETGDEARAAERAIRDLMERAA